MLCTENFIKYKMFVWLFASFCTILVLSQMSSFHYKTNICHNWSYISEIKLFTENFINRKYLFDICQICYIFSFCFKCHDCILKTYLTYLVCMSQNLYTSFTLIFYPSYALFRCFMDSLSLLIDREYFA